MHDFPTRNAKRRVLERIRESTSSQSLPESPTRDSRDRVRTPVFRRLLDLFQTPGSQVHQVRQVPRFGNGCKCNGSGKNLCQASYRATAARWRRGRDPGVPETMVNHAKRAVSEHAFDFEGTGPQSLEEDSTRSSFLS